MTRNKGRRPPDSKPTPESRPASAGTTGAASGGPGSRPANGTEGTADAHPSAGQPLAESPGTNPVGAGAAGASPPGVRPADPGPSSASPASANPAGAAQPSVTTSAASTTGGQPGKPGAPGASARPPAGGSIPGAPAQSRSQSGGTPPSRDGTRGSFRNGLIGGLIGGIVAALVLGYLLRPDDGAELASLRGQVDQLAASLEDLRGGSADLDQLAGRIDALEQAAPPAIDEELQSRLAALEQAAPSAPDQELQARLDALEQMAPSAADLADRIAALETTLAEGAQAPAADERIQALQNELAELSATVAAQALGEGDATASDLAVIETLQARLGALEASVPDAAIAADVRLRLDALAQRVDALGPLAEQSASNQSRLEGLASQIEGLEEQIEVLRERGDAARAKLEGLISRLTATEDRIAETGERREQAAALALLTSQIDSAVAQSRGYDAPLRGLRALGAEDEVVRAAVAELEPSASAGVPSLAQLRRSFEQVAPEVVQSARAPEGDGLIDQAAGNLLRLVTVRPVGADVEGEDAAARVARAEAHLANGDLPAAAGEIEALEGPAAEAAAAWLAEARARLAVSAALDRLQTRTGELLTPSN
jgi:hypothetical protein